MAGEQKVMGGAGRRQAGGGWYGRYRWEQAGGRGRWQWYGGRAGAGSLHPIITIISSPNNQ